MYCSQLIITLPVAQAVLWHKDHTSIYIYTHTHICTTPSQDTLYIVSACSVYNTKTGDTHVAANHQSVIGICPQDEQFENITAADAITERSKS